MKIILIIINTCPMQSGIKYKKALIPLLVVFGAFNTIVLSMMNVQRSSDPSNPHFFHPFVQCVLMFLGEFLCFIPFLLSRRTESKNYLLDSSLYKRKAHVAWPLLPAFMDLLSSSLAYIALNMAPASVWQMSRGAVIITTALFSRVFLKTVFSTAAVFGCLLALFGITGVQVVDYFFTEHDEQSRDNKIIGIILLVVSLVFNSLQLIIEKWIFRKYSISPLKMVFLEGLYGTVMSSAVLVLTSFLRCPWQNQETCSFIYGERFLDHFFVYLQQVQDNSTILYLSAALVLSIGISVPIAVTISKVYSPVSRCLADICRTVVIWAFGLIITVTLGKSQEEYANFEATDPLECGLKVIGFSLMISGILTYHEALPCCRTSQKQSILLTDQEQSEDIVNIQESSQSKQRQSLM